MKVALVRYIIVIVRWIDPCPKECSTPWRYARLEFYLEKRERTISTNVALILFLSSINNCLFSLFSAAATKISTLIHTEIMMEFLRRGLPGFLLVFPIAILLLMQPHTTLSFAPSINLSVASLANDYRRSKELRKSMLPVRNNQERIQHNTDSRLNAVMDIVGVSPEPIHTAFAFATFGPQPFWVLMILLPNNELTKKIMGTMGKYILSHT